MSQTHTTTARPLVLIGNPDNRRTTMFLEALERRAHPQPTLIPYQSLLDDPDSLLERVPQDALVRLDSPGENAQVARSFLDWGHEVEGAWPHIAPDEIEARPPEFGEIYYPAQRFAGFQRLLEVIDEQLSPRPDIDFVSTPSEVLAMFDKAQTQPRLRQGNVQCPDRLPLLEGYDHLRSLVEEHNANRLFIKLRQGSSASGVVAYQTQGPRELAITSSRMVPQGGQLRFFNSLRLARYQRPDELRALFDWLGSHGAVVERWIPKANTDGKAYDLRVLVIDQQAQHTVMRTSRSPMTNLHLGNERGDLEALIESLPPETWRALRQTCQDALACFPGALYAGVDVMLEQSQNTPYILEVNAFGDLLPGLSFNNLDCYEAEIEAMERRFGIG